MTQQIDQMQHHIIRQIAALSCHSATIYPAITAVIDASYAQHIYAKQDRHRAPSSHANPRRLRGPQLHGIRDDGPFVSARRAEEDLEKTLQTGESWWGERTRIGA